MRHAYPIRHESVQYFDQCAPHNWFEEVQHAKRLCIPLQASGSEPAQNEFLQH